MRAAALRAVFERRSSLRCAPTRQRLRACALDGELRAASTAEGGDVGAGARKGAGKKKRLDALCLELKPDHSRNVLAGWIATGKVFVDGKVVTKAGAQVRPTAKVEIKAEEPKYVCRAGLKLERALEHFKLDVSGLTVLDSGLSTGGFTDCLLQNGARRVYGVDVGYGQVADKVRLDERVVVMERTNLRHLDALPEPVDVVTLDLSFISVLKVMPAVRPLMAPGAALVLLIKPQFEARREQVGGGGVVRDPDVHAEVIERLQAELRDEHALRCEGVIESPIRGASKGNKEFLGLFRDDSTTTMAQDTSVPS
mmetsp:Transcript_22711/g.73919  ORF Transcript_22711/g.73919 Transcript_22711/m.73919 type:complete len:311 (+) Transcript_22711:397-1329(+)